MIMKSIAIACVVLLPLPALSQGYSRDEGRGSSYDRDNDRSDDMKDRRSGDHDDERDDSHHMGGRAAMFNIRVGEARMKVKCDTRETMRSCVDAALTLLDKARSLPQTNAAGPNSSNQSPKQ